MHNVGFPATAHLTATPYPMAFKLSAFLRFFRFSALTMTLCYAAASIVVLVLFATPLWFAWHKTVEEGRTELLEDEATRVTNLFLRQGPAAVSAGIQARVEGQPHGIGRVILFADPARRKLAGNLPAWPAGMHNQANGLNITGIDVDGQRMRVAFLCRNLPGGYHLLVGNNVDRFEKLERLFRYGLFGCSGTFLLIAIIGGLVIRRALLSRVYDIGQTTAAIVAGNLAHRLPVQEGNQELETLTRTVNRMLDQIEDQVHAVRNVSNAIAHDLRTPLADLRYRLEELTLTRPEPEPVFSEIEAAIADVDQVLAIFNALLRLAEIDSGTRRSGLAEVEVASLAGEVVEFYHPLAELKDVALTFDTGGDLRTSADALLLAQALGNLIDNALKYAPAHSALVVTAKRRWDHSIAVAVADSGPGIADEEKPKVTGRFYRSDTSRGTPGVGLGLSLVEAVARFHGGLLELNDNHPGLSAVLVLPAVPLAPDMAAGSAANGA